MTQFHYPIRPGAIVTLANNQPAYTRNLRVRQSDINRHGSYAAAKAAVQGRGDGKVRQLRLGLVQTHPQEPLPRPTLEAERKGAAIYSNPKGPNP